MTEVISLREFQQIRDAVSELRAMNPKSALADLVEERIRVIEACYPMLQLGAGTRDALKHTVT
jgi:hypothetical protein